MIKKLLIGITIISLILSLGVGVAAAEETNIKVKQGIIYTWKDTETKNITTVEFAKTKAIDGFPAWANALIDGWTIDVGAAYENSIIEDGAVLLGKEIENLGKYIPIDFPLKDKLSVTIYPLGLYVEDIFDGPTIQGSSGGAFIKFNVVF